MFTCSLGYYILLVELYLYLSICCFFRVALVLRRDAAKIVVDHCSFQLVVAYRVVRFWGVTTTFLEQSEAGSQMLLWSEARSQVLPDATSNNFLGVNGFK
jgi:hypothetical protein